MFLRVFLTRQELLVGSALSNVLQGGAGEDVLWGNAGADQFWLQNDMGRDRIMDFILADGDKIRISKADFGIGSELDSSLFQSNAGGTFQHFSGAQFILNQSDGTLTFAVAEIDSDVGFTSTQIAVFGDGNVLDLPSITDFLIV